MRCEFSRWPENGFIDCSGSSDKMFGTTCNIKCKSGYGLDEGVPTTLKCMKNGAWSPTTIPNCKRTYYLIISEDLYKNDYVTWWVLDWNLT